MQSALDHALAEAPGDDELARAVAIERLRLAYSRGDDRAVADHFNRVAGILSFSGPGGGGTINPSGSGAGVLSAPRLRPDLILTQSPRPMPPPLQLDKPWWLNLAVGTGYDTNARGANSEEIAFSPPYVHPMAFGELRLDAGYSLDQHPDGGVWIGYDLFERAYPRQSIRADLLDQQVTVNADRLLAPTLRAAGRLSEDLTFVGYSAYRNEPAIAASLQWDILPAVRLTTEYDYARDQYQSPTLAAASTSTDVPSRALNRDADNHQATLAAYWAVPDTAIQFRGGFTHAWNFATGSYFDFESDTLFAGMTAALPWSITADIAYVNTLEEYDNLYQTRLTQFAHRHDRITDISIGLAKPINSNLTAFLLYEFNHDNSSIHFYNYQQQVVTIGLSYRL